MENKLNSATGKSAMGGLNLLSQILVLRITLKEH